MARKRLGDLLREEAQKPSEPEVVQAADSEAMPELDTSLAPAEPLDEVTQEPLSTVTNSTNANRRTNPTKADLEATVAELRAALQEVQQHENSLQQQVAHLQLELDDYHILVSKLKAELEQAETVKAELEEAKKVILQLSAVNSPASSAKPASQEAKAQQLALARSPHYSIQPSIQSSELTDADVGWFD